MVYATSFNKDKLREVIIITETTIRRVQKRVRSRLALARSCGRSQSPALSVTPADRSLDYWTGLPPHTKIYSSSYPLQSTRVVLTPFSPFVSLSAVDQITERHSTRIFFFFPSFLFFLSPKYYFEACHPWQL